MTMAESRILAALDIGTNSSLFLLAQVQADGSIHPLRHEVRTNDLGRGLNADQELSASTIELNLGQLREFQQMAQQGGAAEIRIAATEALRRARNAGVLAARALTELGLDIRIIAGAEEAQLTYRGVISGLQNPNAEILVADVGGGSTEIILGTGQAIKHSISLPLGAVSLDRQFIHSDPPSRSEIAAIREEIARILQIPAGFPPYGKESQLIICGGTASSLAAADLGLATYQPEKLAGHQMGVERLLQFTERFSSCTLEERRAIPGIGRRRAEIILPGALIICALLLALGRREYLASERGLRYGLLLA